MKTMMMIIAMLLVSIASIDAQPKKGEGVIAQIKIDSNMTMEWEGYNERPDTTRWVNHNYITKEEYEYFRNYLDSCECDGYIDLFKSYEYNGEERHPIYRFALLYHDIEYYGTTDYVNVFEKSLEVLQSTPLINDPNSYGYNYAKHHNDNGITALKIMSYRWKLKHDSTASKGN